MKLGKWSQLTSAQFPVVFFSNGLGDHLLSLPSLRAISRIFSGRSTLICQRGARRVFFSNLSFHKVYETEVRLGSTSKSFDAYAISRMVKNCDLLISLNPWHSPAVDSLLEHLSPINSVGFFRQFRECVPLNYGKHAADLAFDIPKYFDSTLEIENFSGPPAIVPSAEALVDSIYGMLAASAQTLVVHTETKPQKMWPRDRWVHTLDTFLERHREFVALILGEDDQQLDSGRWGGRVISCKGLSLEAAVALIKRARLFLGVDSCMLHAADLFRIPGVGLFGTTNCYEFGFRFSQHVHVVGSVDMESIPEGSVIMALEDLLSAECGAQCI